MKGGVEWLGNFYMNKEIYRVWEVIEFRKFVNLYKDYGSKCLDYLVSWKKVM